jgi:hypothetical protein
MARVTHVKKAQQRYATVPVIDPETGEQKKVPVMKNGEQKVTKRGPQFMRLTQEDRTKPLEPYRCDFPGCTITDGKILPGQPYKWIKPKSGPYGGTRKNRHEEHPSWQVWEYSSSMSARLAQISHDFWEQIDNCETEDDVQSALDDAGSQIEELAEEKRESAGNIEEGFGHPTEKSEELEGIADELDSWKDEVTGQSIPDLPEPDDRYFIEDSNGVRHGDEDGYDSEEDAQAALDTMIDDLTIDGDADDYQIIGEAGDEPTSDQLDEWRDSLRDELTLIDEPPV